MRIKKRTLRIILLAVAIAVTILIIYTFSKKSDYEFKDNKFYYIENRGKINYQISLLNKTDTLEVYSLKFESRNFLQHKTIIFSLLFMPINKIKLPALILLPGGGVTKESESRLARKIADLGYAVLTFDQRGIGETGGIYLGVEQDYQIFLQGKEPVQHLSVYDALRAYDVLRKMKNIDKNNIAISGESMGGRYAVIAAALEKRLKGVIVISSSGFHIKKNALPYLLSIDPDNYITDISPRYLFMLHGTNDTTVSLDNVQLTFSLAKEPKKFFVAEGCGHGYCEKMDEELKEDLKILLG